MTVSFPISLVWALLAASGAAALGWQFLWTEQLALGLGHETVSALAVMVAFFAGIALGAVVFHRALARSGRPYRWYLLGELAVMAWGWCLWYGLVPAIAGANRLIGVEPSAAWHSLLAFAVPFFLLLPATVAMGITLPAVGLQVASLKSQWGGLYAANTLGALGGLVAVVFWFVPLWGFSRTGLACCALNGLCALLAWALWRKAPPLAASQPLAASGPRRSFAFYPKLLFFTGLLGVGYEVLVVRVLSQVTENTVYSYAVLLATYFVGTGIGAALYQRKCQSVQQDDALLARLMVAVALAVAVSGASLWWADAVSQCTLRLLGPGAMSALAGEGAVAFLAMFAPTMLMGAIFSHASCMAQRQGCNYAQALAYNTAGSALAPLVFGWWLLPWMGATFVLGMLVLGYGVLQLSWRKNRVSLSICTAIAGGISLAAPPLRFIDMTEGSTLLHYAEGTMAAVSVVRDSEGIAHLHINNRVQEGSSASAPVEARLAQIPLLLHPNPRSALFLGVGTGFTSQVAARESQIQVSAVELLPEVIDAVGYFATTPERQELVQRVRMVNADARRFVHADAQRYDVIVGDLFHPARNGAGSLYTVEQFSAVKARLASDGLFCQWLALHQMDLSTLRSIVAAFLRVYPDAVAVLASNSLDSPVLGLLARPGGPLIDMAAVASRLDGLQGKGLLRGSNLDDNYAVVGNVLADAPSLVRFAAGVQANTDDRPVVNHNAPWSTYAPRTPARVRLAELLAVLDAAPGAIVANGTKDQEQRLGAYWLARKRYLLAGMKVVPRQDPERMLDQVQSELLEILQASQDFKPAFLPLFTMAQSISKSNPHRARELLQALHALLPDEVRVSDALLQLP